MDYKKLLYKKCWSFPWVLPALSTMDIVENGAVEHVLSSGTKVSINPTWAKSVSEEELTYEVLYELFYSILGVHNRQQGRDKKTWEMAAQLSLNKLLQELGTKIPDPRFGKFSNPICPVNKSTEEIYKDLKNNSESPEMEEDNPLLTRARRREEEEDRGTIETLNNIKTLLSLSGSNSPLEVFFNIPPSVIRWEDFLKGVFNSTVSEGRKDAECWERRSRRSGENMYLPGYTQEDRHTKVCVAIDTSGSISEQELAQVVSELKNITSVVKKENIILILHHDGAYFKSSMEDMSPTELPLESGGTDFQEAYSLAAGEKVSYFIHLTDGFVHGWPPLPVRKSIIALLEDGGCPPPEGAQVVRVKIRK